MLSCHVRLANESKKLRDQEYAFHTTSENTKSCGEDHILILDFLTTFVVEAETLSTPEAHTFHMMPSFVSGRAEVNLRPFLNGARSEGVTCWPEVVNHFCRTNSTQATIRNAIKDVPNIGEQSR